MLKTFLIACLLFLSPKVFSKNTCHTLKAGTKISLNFPAQDNGLTTKNFFVKYCQKNKVVADEYPGFMRLRFEDNLENIKHMEFSEIHFDSKQIANPIIYGTWDVQKNELTLETKTDAATCPDGQHWDSQMNMCMPDDCPAGQHWDPQMNMCMPGVDSAVHTMFHYNQFMVYTKGQGPRGREAFTAPNMWMLMINKNTSDNNSIGINWMGTTDLWTVPQNGTPQLLQTGEANNQGVPYIDAQHPHSSPVMGLTFLDILLLGKNGQNKLTFFFAPRGEATAGPEAFMHRETGALNPDAPLSHHLQDVFHIASTVAGIKLEQGRWTLEGSTFSGQEPNPSVVNLDMHKPDSYAFRANYKVNDHVVLGGSVAKVNALDRVDNPAQQTEDERAYSAWVTTNNEIRSGRLVTTTIWGQNDNRTEDVKLNSFLEEAVYELGKNNFYGRFEVLQRTPEQLELQITDGRTGAKWVQAITLGFEHRLRRIGDLNVYGGAAITKNFLPASFQPAYGGNPVEAKVYLRLNYQKH